MKIGFIGAGHLAGYMIEGFKAGGFPAEIMVCAPNPNRVENFRDKYKCRATTHNQDVVDFARMIILCVRPDDAGPALKDLHFSPSHTLVSTVAGLTLDHLGQMAGTATAVRVLPISCAAVGKSPVLIYPDHQETRQMLSCLGAIHVMPDESVFAPGTALVGALYAWLFPFMDALAAWTKEQGVDPDTARSLVVETLQGACAMARHQEDVPLPDIWKTLATPGGISELGARVLEDEDAFAAWLKALDAVTAKMQKPRVEQMNGKPES